jgi:hypothetical protein
MPTEYKKPFWKKEAFPVSPVAVCFFAKHAVVYDLLDFAGKSLPCIF